MGVDSRRAPPLPAPTESESVLNVPIEEPAPSATSTDLSSRPGDEKSSYSLPDDGTPVTIRTRGHRHNKSQTSLLIEYFEGGKSEVRETGRSTERRPSVRVRLTPSKSRNRKDHIQITETRSHRKSSRSADPPETSYRSELDVTDNEDASMHSYTSATEESNVSRNPIEVEIDPGRRRGRRKVSSPLIPATDSKVSSYVAGNMSDISGIPTDSFLDGSGGNAASGYIQRAISPLPVESTSEKKHRKVRSESHERSVMQKAVEKASKPERRHKSKSRSSAGEKDTYGHHRKSRSVPPKESAVSAAESSILSSQLSPSHRTYDSQSSSKVSINNPKLLETVEDAIRRLILPELDAIKRERSQRDGKRPTERESLSSLTSRDEASYASKRKSDVTGISAKSRSGRGREARNDLSPQSSAEEVSALDGDPHDGLVSPSNTNDRVMDAAIGAAAASAVQAYRTSKSDDKRQRRRRRAETPKRSHRYSDEIEDADQEVVPPMPLSSEINPSEITRTSILSADSERPQSASEQLAPIQEVPRGMPSMESIQRTPSPARTPVQTLQSLGVQHANVSHGDLKALPRRSTDMSQEQYEAEEYSRQQSMREQREIYEDEYEEEGHMAEPGIYEDEEEDAMDRFFGRQQVPAPLRYVPYHQERRGLSPIQSVSGFTEGESDIHGRRDSRFTQDASEVSSPSKSPQRFHRDSYPGSIPSNMRSREFFDEGSALSSAIDHRPIEAVTAMTEDSELGSHVNSAQAVHMMGANPQMVHQPFNPESVVASLVDGSVLDPSLLSGSQGAQGQRDSQIYYDEYARQYGPRGLSPSKKSDDAHLSATEEQYGRSPSPPQEQEDREPSAAGSREFTEYELDEYGRKVPQTQATQSRHSPTASESAMANAALDMLKRQTAVKRPSPKPESSFAGEGVARNRSFKERADKGGYQPRATPRHSIDRLSDYDHPKFSATGMPDAEHPMPELGYWDDDNYSGQRTPSATEERGMRGYEEEGQDWERYPSPSQEASQFRDGAQTPKASEFPEETVLEGAAAITVAAASGMAAAHSRQPSQDQDDEWQRTSGDRKRDTLVTNPYEDTSPIANLPGISDNMLGSAGYPPVPFPGAFQPSPGLPDEGYMSAPNGPGKNAASKGIPLFDEPVPHLDDPFFAQNKPQRQLSGLSQGMATPLYDPSTGTGIDRIQSKDIIALMEHLMVRDAQRSARDTEILVTLVRSAAEMRNSFEDIKRLLLDTEDQIITEIGNNTEKSLKRHLGGPRPLPTQGSSSSRSIQGGSQSGTADDAPTKKRNFLRKALQGLGAKGASDLTRIEDMLFQLLNDVDVLKHQTAGPVGMSPGGHSVENLQQEQDRGYEPEGHAGTSTASRASHSGHLSIPQSQASKMGFDRMYSDHRISTVPEDNEDEYEDTFMTAANQQQTPRSERVLSPTGSVPRGGSLPPGTPPQQMHHMASSFSNDNTPRTDDGKKHKGKNSTSFFPKISRWSETTTSSIGKVFRSSGGSKKPEGSDEFQQPPSRSGSNLGHYDEYPQQHDPYGEDHLHTGYSEQNLHDNGMAPLIPESPTAEHGPPPVSYSTPEDPKYKAHRNSINLQHPQPRPGQTERFRTALESSAQHYGTPMSPRTSDWAGSATSLNRFPGQNTNRYSDNSAMHSAGDDYNWSGAASPSAGGPPRPPKEPLDAQSPLSQSHTPPSHTRVNQLHKNTSSPQPFHSALESGYGTASATHAGSYHSSSPRPENRNLNSALGVPGRRPSGPRAMTPTRSIEDGEDRRRKRDTFGGMSSPGTVASQETDTF